MSPKKEYETDPRAIALDETEHWMDDFLEGHGIKKIEGVYAYDRNRVTHIASTVGSLWLEFLYDIPTVKGDDDDLLEDVYDAIDDAYRDDPSAYYNKRDISEERGVKIRDNICNFTYTSEDEYEEKWDECLANLKSNHPI